MRALIKPEEYNSNQKLSFLENDFKKIVLPEFQKIFDCIIISSNFKKTNSEEEFTEIVSRLYSDKTGFEVSNTETYIDENLFEDNDGVTMENLLSFTFMIIELWAYQIKHIYGDVDVCFVISSDL